MLIDAIFTFIPFALYVYHLRGLARRSVYHSNQILRIGLCFLISNMLKLYFGVERPICIDRGYVRNFIDRIIYLFTSNYAFPSTHSIFYTQYFMYNMSALNFFLATMGMLSRIRYKHHTIQQVFFGLCLALIMEVALLSRVKLTKKSVVQRNWIRFKVKQNKEYGSKPWKTLSLLSNNNVFCGIL